MQAETYTRDLQVKTTNRQILNIALPISMALVVPQINFLTNNIFLGRLGELELGAAGITGVFYLVPALIGNGLCSGTQAILSRRAGENKPGELGKSFFQAVWITILFSVLAIMLTYMFAADFLRHTIRSADVELLSEDFIRIRIWGLPFLYLFQLGNAFLVSTNNTRLMKYGFMVEAGFNILLDYVLIFGKWGFPQLGFNGAAYASVAAEILAVVTVYGIIIYKKYHNRFRLFTFTKFNPSLSGRVFRMSSPLMVQWGMSVISWMYFYILIENTGELELAISNTMRNIFGLFGIFSWAFAQTTNSMVSNIIGQGKTELVLHLVKKIMKLSLLFSISLCLLINIFPDIFLALYKQSGFFNSEALPVIRMVSAGVVLMSMATVWLNAVTGSGNSKMNLYFEIIVIIFYCLYIFLVIRIWNLSLVWAWSSELLYWGMLLVLSLIFMNSSKWKLKAI